MHVLRCGPSPAGIQALFCSAMVFSFCTHRLGTYRCLGVIQCCLFESLFTVPRKPTRCMDTSRIRVDIVFTSLSAREFVSETATGSHHHGIMSESSRPGSDLGRCRDSIGRPHGPKHLQSAQCFSELDSASVSASVKCACRSTTCPCATVIG
jgi:hypothetical protein